MTSLHFFIEGNPQSTTDFLVTLTGFYFLLPIEERRSKSELANQSLSERSSKRSLYPFKVQINMLFSLGLGSLNDRKKNGGALLSKLRSRRPDGMESFFLSDLKL